MLYSRFHDTPDYKQCEVPFKFGSAAAMLISAASPHVRRVPPRRPYGYSTCGEASESETAPCPLPSLSFSFSFSFSFSVSLSLSLCLSVSLSLSLCLSVSPSVSLSLSLCLSVSLSLTHTHIPSPSAFLAFVFLAAWTGLDLACAPPSPRAAGLLTSRAGQCFLTGGHVEFVCFTAR